MFKKPQIEENLDTEILALLKAMSETEKTGDSYEAMVDQLSKLYELRHKSRISNETLATIAANVAGIVLIIAHERTHVIATKAFALVKKLF